MINTTTKTIVIGVAAGLFASWIKSLAEPPLQKIGEKRFPPSPEALELKGADVTGRPEKMPPAILAKDFYHTVTDRELSYEETLQAMTFIHYALGAFVGITYSYAVSKNRIFSVAGGAAAGAAVWGLTHGSVVPALGLQGKVKDMPEAWWVWEFGSHVVFGIAMEQSRRILYRLF